MKTSIFTWKEKFPFLYLFSMLLVGILYGAWLCPIFPLKIAFLALAPLVIFFLYDVAST